MLSANIAIFRANNGMLKKVPEFMMHSYSLRKDLAEADYQEEISSFQNITKNSTSLFKELGCDNLDSTFYSFLYLLHNGFYSLDKFYGYDISVGESIYTCPGANVIYGSGNCNNNSDLLYKIFKNAGYEAYSIWNNFETEEIYYSPDIQSNYINNITTTEQNKTDLKLQGNHVAVLVKDNNRYRVFDPTTYLVYDMDKRKSAKLVTGIGRMDIKFFSLLFLHQESDKTVRAIMHEGPKNYTPTNLQEMTESAEQSMARCHDNTTLLNDFHANNYADMSIIANKIRTIRKERG